MQKQKQKQQQQSQLTFDINILKTTIKLQWERETRRTRGNETEEIVNKFAQSLTPTCELLKCKFFLSNKHNY
ncbi:hypothetical protein T08_15524 [Trichinella sp. T8]|nr:hypothetical protein T08_15524 [Trichinella sp. T8]